MPIGVRFSKSCTISARKKHSEPDDWKPIFYILEIFIKKESVDKASENSHKLEEKETRVQFQETTSLHGTSLSMETVVESTGATFAALMFVFTWLLKNRKSVVGEAGSALPLIFPTQMTELTQEKSGEGTESGSELSSESLILAINYEAISESVREDLYTFLYMGRTNQW